MEELCLRALNFGNCNDNTLRGVVLLQAFLFMLGGQHISHLDDQLQAIRQTIQPNGPGRPTRPTCTDLDLYSEAQW